MSKLTQAEKASIDEALSQIPAIHAKLCEIEAAGLFGHNIERLMRHHATRFHKYHQLLWNYWGMFHNNAAFTRIATIRIGWNLRPWLRKNGKIREEMARKRYS